MHIVIAPGSFKESMTAFEVAENIRKGIHDADPGISTKMIPLADGGEGTVHALIDSTGGRVIRSTVHDPLMRKIKSFYGILEDHKTAVIEMAAASGIELLEEKEKDPLITSTYGTGELIRSALDMGCTRIIIGIGGSATNDGGAGMMQALGIKFYDHTGKKIRPEGGGSLLMIQSIDLNSLDERLTNVEFIIASDVDNPLLGNNGASFTYGPQKGADSETVQILEKSMEHFANIIEGITKKEIRSLPGAGAAGGLGFGMMIILNASLKPGFEIISEFAGLENSIREANIVITGEGKIDVQTRFGKTPFGVAKIAKKYNIPVLAFTGNLEENTPELYKDIFKVVVPIVNRPMKLETALMKSHTLLRQAAKRVMNLIILGKEISW